MVRYIIRLDDACPYMDRGKWQQMETLLDKYGIKPLVGIIPAVADTEVMKDTEDVHFWEKAHEWEQKGWSIALHGYDHVCISNDGMKGLNPMWKRSEFTGLPLDVQREKIRKGVAILRNHGLDTKCFFAPSHTFDEHTLEALRLESDIRVISDTIGRYPYRRGEFVFVPQIAGHCVEMPVSGVYTFCFHPNMMSETGFFAMESFLQKNYSSFLCFNELSFDSIEEKPELDRMISWLFFTIRQLRGKY